MKEKITVMIVDDHARFRNIIIEDLTRIGIKTITQAANGKEALALFEKVRPDIILLDLNMPVMDGNETFDILMERYPGTHIIILSFHCDDIILDDYMRRGAKGFIPKNMAVTDVLKDAFEAVKKGSNYVIRHESTTPEESIIFSKTQAALIPLMCSGLTNKEISDEQGVGVRNVEKRRKMIYERMGVDKSVGFYRKAFSLGWQFLKGVRNLNR